MADVAETEGQYESRAEEAAKGEANEVQLWCDALAISDKEEEKWRDRAEKTVETYRDEKERKQRRYNILYANTETLLPALYNSTPIPDVRPRFNSADPIAKIAARTLEKAISHCIDEYDFDTEIEAAIQDMALPGRGVARIRYDPLVNDETNFTYHRVTVEHVPWAQFRRGPGKLWRDVPWVAFCHFLTRDELRRLSPRLANQVRLDASLPGYDRDKSEGPPKEVFLRAQVWEIWDRESREVLFLAPSFKERFLQRLPDPLSLTGFFPLPRPLYAVKTTDSLVPVELYNVYRDQAEELDRITRRITALIEVLKWRGLYAASEENSGALSLLMQANDGDLVPATDFLSLVVQGGALERAIFLMPIDRLIGVIEQLYLQREQIKQTIYEITGVADIMRGTTDPDETLGAQQIKTQWGSLRVQRQQAEIQRFVRDLFRLKAEIIAEKFPPEQLVMITEEQITPEVVAMLKQDVLRSYRIDVETDSTVRADLTRTQENMANFVQGTAQYIAAVGPAVQAGQMPSDVAAEIYTAFARTFKLGKQAEDALDRMSQAAQQPQPQQPNPEEVKAQAEQQRMQMQAGIDQAKAQADMQAKQAEAQMKLQLMAADMEAKQADLAIKREELELKREEMALKRQDAQFASQTKRMEAEMSLRQKQAESEIGLQSQREMAQIKKSQAMQRPKAREPA